ncbi:MAG: RNA polymerase sigma factor [Oscillospiraceae bacterium]|jgi:RNA polymerase sigma-70 factor (ECF subfamily)|nr:RNA polymerase sigma factor [Oscillospiraceae bacterium]
MDKGERATDIAGELAYLRFLGGDESALDTLVSLYRESLLFFIGGYVRNLSDAEELAADVFMEFSTSAWKFKSKASVKTFLFSIGRNLACKFVRAHKSDIKTAGADDVETVADETTPEADFLKDEQSRLLHRAIKKLKAEYREVLYLLYFEDMIYREAGIVLKKSVKQIENLSRRARASLKNILESEGFTYG